MFDVIAFDADDTLWHNETLYSRTQDKFKQLLSKYHPPEWIEDRLFQTEMRNLQFYGYGIKSFALSMIETAIELTEGRISGSEIQKILDYAKEMLAAEIQLLDHVDETIASLAAGHELMLITKGDLLDQEAKLARSGLARHFKFIEIVSDKTPESYAAILAKYHIQDPRRFLMVGNSLRSDILPVTALGGQAVYIPYHLTWVHENIVSGHEQPEGYLEIEHIGLLPGLIERLSGRLGPAAGGGAGGDSAQA